MRNNQEEELLEVDNVLDIKLSYSKLSSFDLEGPKTLIHRKDLSGDGIDEGGYIDTLLFTPEEADKDFYVFDGVKPTATLGKLVDTIVENFNDIPSTKEIVEISKKAKYWNNVKDEEIYLSKFDTEDFWGYLKAQYEAKGKTILSTEQVERDEEVVDVLKSHKHSKDIVAFPNEFESKYVQFPIEYRYDNVIFRGILDLLVVNHKNKTVQMVDLKTGAPSAEAFSTSFVKYRYYLQEAVYQQAFKSICEKLGLEGYELLPFKFLYISRFEKIPLIYTVPEKWSKAAIKGFTTKGGYKYKGLVELVSDITWHWTNQKFALSRETYEREGNLILNDDFIEIDE